MKKNLLTLLGVMLIPLLSMAQYFESGTTKTGQFYNYSTSGSSYQQTELWYSINLTEDGEAFFDAYAIGNVRIDDIRLYAVVNGENVSKTGSTYVSDTQRTLTASNLAKGVYNVRVTGRPTDREGRGGTFQVKYQFTAPNIANDPEPNDGWALASLIEDGMPQQGHLGFDYYNSTDNVDWFKIEVKEDGKATFMTKSETTLRLGSLYVYALNADGKDVVNRGSKDMDGYNKDTTVVFEIPNLSVGTYYIGVNRYRGYGGYTLSYYFTSHSELADPEPNNTWHEAVELKSGPSVSGQLGYEYSGDTDNDDWYKIDVPDEGSITFSTLSETTLRLGSLYVYALNADETDVVNRGAKDMDGYNKDTTVVFTIPDVKAGTYYIRLHRYRGYGTYTLQYTFNVNSHAKDPEPNDEWSMASIIENGQTQQGRLGYYYSNDYDNNDWFKIDVPDEGSITFSTLSETTLRLSSLYVYALNADGTDVVNRGAKDMDGYNKDTTVVFTIPDVKAGTYYIRLPRYRGYGGYKLKYVFTANTHGADSEPNEEWGMASIIENGQTQQGRLGYYYSNDYDNEDWFKIDVPCDGDAIFTTTSDETLRLGSLYVYALNADGTDVVHRVSKDMDGYNKPDTVVICSAPQLAAGTYYIRLPRYRGYGGYNLTYHFTKNPYFREEYNNNSFSNRMKLEEGKAVYTTLGYYYNNINSNNEDWYDLGSMHGRQIDVTVNQDVSHSLSIGIATLYRYKGNNEDGSPILEGVTSKRLERSSGTISYIDKNTEDSHYVFKVPRYSGHGGYSIVFGDDMEKGELEVNSSIAIMTGGRNTVRKGVPCENPITISNLSDKRTDPFFIGIVATNDVKILGFHIPTNKGTYYVPMDSVGIPGDSTAVFVVPYLDPWESYTFTMVSEGVGDIAYAPIRYDVNGGPRKIVFTGTTITVAALGAFALAAGKDLVKTYVIDTFTDAFNSVVDVHGKEAEQYASVSGATFEQLGLNKQNDGAVVYTAKSVTTTALTTIAETVAGGPISTAVSLAGDVIGALNNIIPSIRRRIWYWIYKDLGYIKEKPDVLDAKQAVSNVVASWDPNEMCGPLGVGNEHYIGDVQTVNYTILFENKAEAGASAYRVRVSDELDENVFDVNSVVFGKTSHEGVGYNWKTTREGNKLYWDIEGIELPPNVHAPEGEGYVSFSVNLKQGLADGTKIKNKATIIFDKNFPIETNEYVNTLDITAPVTTMLEPWYKEEDGGIYIACDSYDEGSGVDSYLLYVSKNGGEYTYEGMFPRSAVYPVTPADGNTYDFYVIATDNVGNTEQAIPQSSRFENTASAIHALSPDQIPTDKKVYTIDGRYIGDSVKGLSRGVYIRGGKKIVIK